MEKRLGGSTDNGILRERCGGAPGSASERDEVKPAVDDSHPYFLVVRDYVIYRYRFLATCVYLFRYYSIYHVSN